MHRSNHTKIALAALTASLSLLVACGSGESIDGYKDDTALNAGIDFGLTLSTEQQLVDSLTQACKADPSTCAEGSNYTPGTSSTSEDLSSSSGDVVVSSSSASDPVNTSSSSAEGTSSADSNSSSSNAASSSSTGTSSSSKPSSSSATPSSSSVAPSSSSATPSSSSVTPSSSSSAPNLTAVTCPAGETCSVIAMTYSGAMAPMTASTVYELSFTEARGQLTCQGTGSVTATIGSSTNSIELKSWETAVIAISATSGFISIDAGASGVSCHQTW